MIGGMIPARMIRPTALDMPGVRPTSRPPRSYLELGALAGAVPCARLHARQVLWEWRLEALADTVELLVSELVTNAIWASAHIGAEVAPVRLWLGSNGQRVVIRVWDGCPRMPIRRDPESEAEGGRGLLLVESLSAEWGSYRPEGSGGKVVWAVVA